jgi:hypothetical protein
MQNDRQKIILYSICLMPFLSIMAVITLLSISGCQQPHEARNSADTVTEVTVVFDPATPQDTIDRIIAGGNFTVLYRYPHPSTNLYDLGLPSGMTYEEACRYLRSFPCVLATAPSYPVSLRESSDSCLSGEVYLWSNSVCVPKPDSNGTCPDGYEYAGCGTSTCPTCDDCIAACVPEGILLTKLRKAACP